jgi:hypothetical protein
MADPLEEEGADCLYTPTWKTRRNVAFLEQRRTAQRSAQTRVFLGFLFSWIGTQRRPNGKKKSARAVVVPGTCPVPGGTVGLQVLALADGGKGQREAHMEGQGVVVACCGGGGAIIIMMT